MRNAVLFERLISQDLNICLWFNRGCRHAAIKQSFTFISWLGDGKFWYTIMVSLPFALGQEGFHVSLHLVAVGIAGLLVYKIIKTNTHRLRPYMASQAVSLGTSPLDQYSFPSGHTLHAVSFTIILLSYFPALLWFLLPFTILVALSRVILGLHYPSDVGIGALIGFILAITSLQF